MKRRGNLWPQLVTFANILESFRQAAKGKGMRPYVLYFIANFEHNVLQLQDDLQSKSYRPGNYNTFYIYEPKKRMISAAPFIDRIVHHCLVNVIGPIFEATFVQQSYANQVNKGSHRAIRDIQSAMRLNRYILQCDIRKYFPNIDHEILKELIRRKIKDPEVLWLIDIIIDGSNPQEPFLTWFPGDNLLTPIDRRKGLPIGNLTSQFFANVYLNGLDHFVKETLQCQFYGRYVDDLAALDNDKLFLHDCLAQISEYLETLRLRLHPNKSHIRPVTSGVKFLGQIVYPEYRLLPKSNVRRFMRRMKKFQLLYASGRISFQEINHSVQSWMGHARQAYTLALRRDLFKKIIFRRKT